MLNRTENSLCSYIVTEENSSLVIFIKLFINNQLIGNQMKARMIDNMRMMM